MRWNIEDEPNDEDVKVLLSVAQIDGEFYLHHKQNPEELTSRDLVWEVVKTKSNKGINFRGVWLTKHMKIKFGWVMYEVVDISTEGDN